MLQCCLNAFQPHVTKYFTQDMDHCLKMNSSKFCRSTELIWMQDFIDTVSFYFLDRCRGRLRNGFRGPFLLRGVPVLKPFLSCIPTLPANRQEFGRRGSELLTLGSAQNVLVPTSAAAVADICLRTLCTKVHCM